MKNDTARIAVIDVLRLFAALGVVIFHVAGAAEVPKHTLPPIAILGHTLTGIPSPFSFGATGVSLFFVISGYCMFNSLEKSKLRNKDYYQSRFARIYPAYFFAVIFSAIVMACCGFAQSFLDIISKLLFLHGFIQQYNLSINGALWSMATEVQFYLALPLLFALAKRMGPVNFWAACLALSLAFRLLVGALYPGGDPVGGIVTSTFLSNLLPGRLSEFAVGMLIAATAPDRARRVALVAIIPVTIVALATRVTGPAFAAEPLLGLFYAAVMVLLLGAPKLFGSQDGVPAALGRASYALFLLHLPIIVALATAMRFTDQAPLVRFGLLLVPTLILSMLMALALHAWIEMPFFRRLRPRPQRDDTGAP